MIENPTEKDEIYLSNVKKIGNSIDNIQYIENVLSEKDFTIVSDFIKNSKDWINMPWGSQCIEYNSMTNEIVQILEKVFTFVHEKSLKHYDVEINPVKIDSINILKFSEGFGLEPHIDTASAEKNHIASIYYMNDNYEGGEIYFLDFDLLIKPKPNSVIIFPGNEGYLHGVNVVIDGDRITSSMWFQFTGSTFNKQAEWYNKT